MRRFSIILITMVLFSITGCLLQNGEPRPINIVRNGSFEELKDNGYPEQWGYGANSGEADFAVDSGVSKTGNVAFKVSAISDEALAQINQRLDSLDGLVSDETYSLSLWYRTENMSFSTRLDPFKVPIVIRIRFRDANGNAIAATDEMIISDRPEHVIYYSNIHLGVLDLANDEWRLFTVDFHVPPNTDYMFLELFLWHTKGTVWFDEVCLTKHT